MPHFNPKEKENRIIKDLLALEQNGWGEPYMERVKMVMGSYCPYRIIQRLVRKKR